MGKYGLKLRGKKGLLHFKTTVIKGRNGEENEIIELCQVGDGEWLVDSVEEVQKALDAPIAWYGASYSRPVIKFEKKALEVIHVEHSGAQEVDTDATEVPSSHMDKLFERLANDKDTITFKESANTSAQEDGEDSAASQETEGGVLKVKVQCLQDIPKEMGSVRLKTDPVSNCFTKGKHYLAYTHNEKLYVVNEDRIPEYICNAYTDSDWKENFFFRTHFSVAELLTTKNT